MFEDEFGNVIPHKEFHKNESSEMKKPLIVACTSEIITSDLKNKLESIGFDLVF